MDDNDLLGVVDADVELVELVKTRKWSAVVDLCEKKLKKGDTRDQLQIYKIVALLLGNKSSGKERARRDLDALLNRTPPVIDASTLSLLESLAQTYHGEAELTAKLGRIWERASTALSKNEWALRTWFHSRFRKGSYNEAKQAAMVWMKAYPKHHDPFYLFIIVNFIISKAPQTKETDRKLCQLLAYKALATAAADTLDENDQLVKGPGRILESQEDLALLLRIYKDQGKYVEALSILDDWRKGFASPLGNRSWELALQVIELQGLCEHWETQRCTCRDILQAARPEKFKVENSDSPLAFGERGDDWKVWQALVTATVKLSAEKTQAVKETEQLIADFSSPKSRNASLAFLKLHSQGAVADPKSKKLFKKCQKYFEDYSTKIACFQDLRPHISGLSRSHQEMLIANITRQSKDPKPTSASTTTWIKQVVSDINSLKLDYHLIVSRATQGDQSRLLPAFVIMCLRLYQAYLLLDVQLPQSDRGVADDAAILAAMGLLLMYHLGDKKALLRSVVVLEYLVSHSKHNYDALLILVRIYMSLGAGSLAMSRYARLTIKNIQHASISWILFTRLSTIHPWPANISTGSSATTIFDPLDELEQAIGWHRGAGILTGKALNRMMNNKQWNMMFGLLETQESLQYGFAQTMLVAECQRIQRTRNLTRRAARGIGFTVPSVVRDNRDRTAFPNYQPSDQPTLDESLPTASPLEIANSQWLKREASLACLWDRINDKQCSWEGSQQLRLLANYSYVDLSATLTNAEIWTSQLLSRVKRLLSLAVIPPETSSNELLADLESLQNSIMNDLRRYIEHENRLFITITMNQSLPIPLWHTFHTSFSLLEIVSFSAQCMNKITKSSGIKATNDEQERLEKKFRPLRNLMNDLQQTLYEDVTKLRDTIATPESGYLIALQGFVKGEDELGAEMTGLITGTITVDEVCASFRESWVDALDGVLRTHQAP